MTLHALATLLVLHLGMAILPGPNFLAIAGQSMAVSRRAGLVCALGVGTGSAVWMSLCMAGAGAVLVEGGWLYGVLRAVGAAWLLWVAAGLVWRAWRGPVARPPGVPPFPSEAPRALGRPFRLGLVTTLANPKSAAFWLTVFVVAIPPATPAPMLALLVLAVTAQALAWYGLVALVFARPRPRAWFERRRRAVEAVTGGVFAAFGIRLALGG